VVVPNNALLKHAQLAQAPVAAKAGVESTALENLFGQ
jgi:hypothetical protein